MKTSHSQVLLTRCAASSKAIKETGNQLVAAVDPFDSVGILDSFFPECAFFTEYERFDRHLEKLKHKPDPERIHFLYMFAELSA